MLSSAQAPHQFGKAAVFAERVGMFAEIADDLQQPLLQGCRPQWPGVGPAEKPLAREAQHRVVLSPAPGKVTMFGDLLRRSVFPDDGPHPKPGKNHIHRNVSDTLHAQQRF